jgi:hypothetical protein
VLNAIRVTDEGLQEDPRHAGQGADLKDKVTVPACSCRRIRRPCK